MARNEAGLKKALSQIPALREEFWKNVRVLGANEEFNQSLEKAGRVADFFELAELMCLDALDRKESCGGHFREEYQTPEGEALRDDANYSYVAAWQHQGDGRAPALTKLPLPPPPSPTLLCDSPADAIWLWGRVWWLFVVLRHYVMYRYIDNFF